MKTTAVIRPSRPAGTIIPAPPCKSMAHRLLICAGLSDGTSRIRNLERSEDILATMDCLNALGASCTMKGTTAVIRGADVFRAPGGAVLPCRECGSTMRFLVPLGLLGGEPVTLTGSRKLLSRPLSVYETICEERGLSYRREEEQLLVQGPLPAGTYTLPGNISSQFISGLLFALPLLREDSVIRILPPVESRPYIDMTLAAMKQYGVRAEWQDEETISVPGRQRYRAGEAAVEGDWSNAAFPLAMGIGVSGLDPDSLQGDRCCAELMEQLRNGSAEADLSDCPDLGPVLFAYAAAHHGGHFTGTERLRIKESDRVAAMAEELKKFGVEMQIGENEVTVPAGIRAPQQELEGHGDHRIVMALTVLCAETGGSIRGAEAVAKSWPEFFKRLKNAGIEVEINGMDQ